VPGASGHRAFVALAALACAGSAALTVAWCRSMAAMPGMDMPGGWTMSMAWMRMPGQGWPGAAADFLGMWTVMMVAMMLPASLPTLLAFRRTLDRHSRTRRAALTLFAMGGYFAAWLVLGAAIYLAGACAAGVAMRSAGVARLAPAAGGLALVTAGILQAGGWKSRALARCRAAHCCATPGAARNAWRLGLTLGLRCVRCCAPWTLALLVLGVMDLAAMAFATVAINLERLLPRGERVARVAGIALLAAGMLALTNT
jgi:predicted metal-binding membrane protein